MFDLEYDDSDLELDRSVDDVLKRIFQQIADDAPDEMRRLMVFGGVSSKGEPPRRQTERLAKSLKGDVVFPDEAELEMIYYGQYLDPLFEKGYLDRPFIERGIAKSIEDLK